MRTKHKKLSVSSCGLFLDKDLKFVGASPDGLVMCSCCCNAILEIKCPYSINYQSPVDTDVDYLVNVDNVKKLKVTHKYYTQCQLQMHVTGIKRCFFFVWTSHGYVIDEIFYDNEFCAKLVDYISIYYDHFLDYKFGKST